METTHEIILEDDLLQNRELNAIKLGISFAQARAKLQQCDKSGKCLYDQLANIIQLALSDPHETNNFEYYKEKCTQEEEEINDDDENQINRFKEASITLKMIRSIHENRQNEDSTSNHEEVIFENVCSFGPYYKMFGLIIPSQDLCNLSLSMEQINRENDLKMIQFWGKIFGTKNSYWIIEVQKEEVKIEEEQEIEEKHKESLSQPSPIKSKSESTKLEADPNTRPPITPIPQSKYQTPPPLPKEESGSGTNRFKYFTAIDTRGPWTELPDVTPKEIVESRKINKFLTGNLRSSVKKYPCSLKEEKQILRALIARISHGTYVAPIDSYTTKKPSQNIDDDEEEEEEEEEIEEEEPEDSTLINNDKQVYKNPKYKPLLPIDLINTNMWSHVRPFIRENGRVTSIVNKSKDEEGEEEEEDEEESLKDEAEKEKSDENSEGHEEKIPPLFQICSEDDSGENFDAWRTKVIYASNQMDSLAIMKSNIWPGAYSFAIGNTTNFVYFGWGNKLTTKPANYMPPMMQEEYPTGPEIFEIIDANPTEVAKEIPKKNDSGSGTLKPSESRMNLLE